MDPVELLCQRFGVRSYFEDPSGLVGVYHNQKYWWHQWNEPAKAYRLTGTTEHRSIRDKIVHLPAILKK